MTRAACVKCCGSRWVGGGPCPRCRGEGDVEVGPDRLPRRRVPEYATERAELALVSIFARAGKSNARNLARTIAGAFAWTMPPRPVEAVIERSGVDLETAERVVRAYTAALREHARAKLDAEPYSDSRGAPTRRLVEALHSEADLIDTTVRMHSALAALDDQPRAAE